MSGSTSDESAGASSKSTSSSSIHQPRQRMAQNYLLLWIDASMDEADKDCQDILAQLKNVVNEVHLCSQSDQCIQLVKQIDTERAFVITSGYFGQHLVPKIHARLSDESIWYTCLENLSNEVVYEIFEYLDGCDIYKSFSNLNIRLQNLIISSSLLLRIELDPLSKHLLEHHCQHVIIPNSHRILSLHLADYWKDQLLIDAFFNHCIIDSSFQRLESIMLKGIKTEKLLTTLFYLKFLPRLFSLTMYIKDYYYHDPGNIYPLIFSLPTLKYNRLSRSTHTREITIPHVINKKFSTIQYLIIDHTCTLNQLNSILHYTPQLRHLYCNPVIDSNEEFKNDLAMKLPHLKSLYIEQFYESFDEFEMFIKEISSPLQILNITVFWGKAYLDSNGWERLIKEYMPGLEKFYFHFNHMIHDDFTKDLIDLSNGFINQFNSPFWVERKWFREIRIDYENIDFSIHPYREEWIDLHEHMKSDHRIMQLIIMNNQFTELTWRFIKELKCASKAIHFTHLGIEDDSMCIHMLLDTLSSLPNIKSLKLSSPSIFPLKSLPIEDTENYRSVLAINKITKVKLGQVTEEQEEQQIQFFINLCPHIEYLGVDCMSDTDVPSLMKLILMNRRTRIPNLCYLCFIIPMADENMVRTLAMTIDSERVNDNYTIQRSGNKISVYWK
ncbi:unnamed protein product [Adineta steineri]|uniref:F-box domain-containing protein n=1 Tax=Adineta steineri TaxID=433720 RepID=A0A813QE85_9BILA|nr:unnamed protein product [Adineta steineri]